MTIALSDLYAGFDELEHQLAATAVQRDKQGGHAGAEKELLRQRGFTLLAVPKIYGGIGATWPEIFHIARRLARVDSAMSHLVAFQALQIAGVLAWGSEAQKERYLTETVKLNHWWGNSANPADPRLRAHQRDGGLVLQGDKGFCSGTLGSYRLLTTAIDETSGKVLVAVLPTAAPGISVADDWDAIGQRQTDSGAVHFEQVRLEWEDVLLRPDATPTPFENLRGLLAQSILVNLYLGIAEGAFQQARDYTLEQTRPWFASGVARAADDPYLLHRYAEMHLQILSAKALADQLGDTFQAAWQRGSQVTAQERGEVALAAAEAKVLAQRAALGVSQELFDVCGARATAAVLGLDRYWRNARTHTLHDPIDYKLRDIGRYALERRLPEPTLYS